METKESTIQNNVRIYPDDKEAFGTYCKNNNISQAEGFRIAMEALKLSGLKREIPERAAELDEVKKAIDLIMAKYTDSVRYADDTAQHLRQEYEEQIARREQTIRELKTKIDLLEKELKQNTTFCEQLQDKNTIIEQLMEQLNQLRDKAELYDKLGADYKQLELEFGRLTTKLHDAEKDQQIAIRDAVATAEAQIRQMYDNKIDSLLCRFISRSELADNVP